MRITKRQLRRIIKEEILSEVTPAEREEAIRLSHVDMKQHAAADPAGQIDDDMEHLLGLLKEAEAAADKIHQLVSSDVEYSQYAGGREADDVELALSKVWQAFGGQSLSAEGFDEPL